MAKFFSYFDAAPSARTELLVRLICLLFAFDVWANPIARAGRYGHGDFNVAHFQILDFIYPMPSPGIYLSALLLASFAAITVTALGPNRWNVPVLAASWGYAWSSAYIDGFQHHYFLALVFICFMGIPRRDSSRVAWGYPLLCATIANMYFWAAVAKTDPTWIDGSRLATILGSRRAPLEAFWVSIGLGADWTWAAISVATILLELVLCAAYFIAPWASKPWHRAVLWVGLALALGLHVGAEIINLDIKWFSHYMLMLAVFCLTPDSISSRVEARLRSFSEKVKARFGGKTPPGAPWVWALAAGLAVLGYLIPADLPGTGFAAGAIVMTMIAATLMGLPRTRTLAASFALASAAFSLTIDVSESRYDYWRFVGASSSRSARAQTDPSRKIEYLKIAIDAYERTDRHAPDGKGRKDTIQRLHRRLEAARK